jgi:hemerythrin
MLGCHDIESVHRALVLGPDGDGPVAGERGRPACDPFYRAWLRSARRELTRNALSGKASSPVDLTAARGWVSSGEWGDTASADLDMLAFDHDLLAMLGREVTSALVDGRAYAEAAAAVRLLHDCSRVHEDFEELLMELHQDPDRAIHAEGHRSLQAQREQFLACHARGDLAAARSVHAALRHWSDEHLRGPDQSLQRFLGAVDDAP